MDITNEERKQSVVFALETLKNTLVDSINAEFDNIDGEVD